jgi:hypothetical protein
MLREVFVDQLPPSVRAWLDSVFARRDEESLLAAFSQRFSDVPWCASPEASRMLADNRLGWLPNELDLTTALRVMILVHATTHAPPAHTLVRSWYVAADTDGRRAVLRALPLLSRPKQFLDVAIRGASSPDADVFGAIALHNPYPAAFFSDAQFDELVARVADRGMVLANVIGVEERALAGASSSRDALRLTQERVSVRR